MFVINVHGTPFHHYYIPISVFLLLISGRTPNLYSFHSIEWFHAGILLQKKENRRKRNAKERINNES